MKVGRASIALRIVAASAFAATAAVSTQIGASASTVSHPFARGGAWMGWSLALGQGQTPTPVAVPHTTKPHGLDVSGYQGSVDWATVKADGAKFVYIKATEGNYYTNPDFAQQYNGSYNAKIIRGSYHFAIPNDTTGAAQAQYFVDNGGGWSSDGRTLPGALDIEYNPYGAECYGLSQSAMVSWIASFVDEYHALEGVWPVVYSTADWWDTCTGNSTAFSSNDPLWLADYNSTAGTIPGNWGVYTFWQYADSGKFPGDQNVFNGSMARLKVLAKQG